jgi:two-component system, OmpR family, response regulator
MRGRILVIDDNQAVLAAIRTALEAASYEVVTTAQTVGAGRHLKVCDLVIIDYHMPGLDGRAVLESLKSAAASAHTKPAFYLYTSDAEIQQEARRLGFDGAFSKKGNREALVAQVDAAFRMLRLRALQKK